MGNVLLYRSWTDIPLEAACAANILYLASTHRQKEIKARSMSKTICLNGENNFIMNLCCSFVIAKSRIPIAIAFHTFISSLSPKHIFIGHIVGHQTSLLRPFVSTTMQDVLLRKDVQQVVANVSIRSMAVVISLAHFCIIDVHASQSFPLSLLGPDSHLS